MSSDADAGPGDGVDADDAGADASVVTGAVPDADSSQQYGVVTKLTVYQHTLFNSTLCLSAHPIYQHTLFISTL